MASLLLTGASGFLGSNILPLLKRDFDSVTTLGRSHTNDVRADLAVSEPELTRPCDIVLHAAGKTPSGRRNDAREFFDINVSGTRNLCRALEKGGVPRAFVFISTVAVYGVRKGSEIDETHSLDGSSPYALSKIEAERFLTQWCATHDVILTILRPALIMGDNPGGTLSAMIEGIRTRRYLNVSGGRARKSMVLASDIARLVPVVANRGGIYNLCDSRHPSYAELSALIAGTLGRNKPRSFPAALLKPAALMGDLTEKLTGLRLPVNSQLLHKLTDTLTFSNKKLIDDLGFQPSDVLSCYCPR